VARRWSVVGGVAALCAAVALAGAALGAGPAPVGDLGGPVELTRTPPQLSPSVRPTALLGAQPQTTPTPSTSPSEAQQPAPARTTPQRVAPAPPRRVAPPAPTQDLPDDDDGEDSAESPDVADDD